MIALEPWETQAGSGYSDHFVLASGVLFATTALSSNISIILRFYLANIITKHILRKFKDKDLLSLSSSRELTFVILSFVAVMTLGLELPALDWQKRLKLLALGISCLLTSNFGTLALKVRGVAMQEVPFPSVFSCAGNVSNFTKISLIFGRSCCDFSYVEDILR